MTNVVLYVAETIILEIHGAELEKEERKIPYENTTTKEKR